MINNDYTSICNICQKKITSETIERGVQKMRIHLTNNHSEEIQKLFDAHLLRSCVNMIQTD